MDTLETDLRPFSALSSLDVEHVVGVRRLSDVTFEHPVRVGDDIRVEVTVDQTRDLTAERVVVETSWRIVNQLGQILVHLRADMVCRRCREVASDAKHMLLPPGALDAELECVDNIPV